LKYSTAIVIDLPRPRVIDLFTDINQLTAWQPGLERAELLEGEPGQPGAKTRLVYQRDRREVEIIETIIGRNQGPDEQGPYTLIVGYETRGVRNQVVNVFEAMDGEHTRWTADNEFNFRGWMLILSLFLGSAFRKQTLDDMKCFKSFAERA